MDQAVRRLVQEFGCRIINISLCDRAQPVGKKPSAWAAALDSLARELNIVIIVSAGNRTDLWDAFGDGIVRRYPAYLVESANRILEPSSAANVLTVGSLAHGNGMEADDIDYVGVRPIADLDHPSPFTRTGPGVGGMIKPDLVDYGGTAVLDGVAQTVVSATPHRPSAGLKVLHHKYLEHHFTSKAGTSISAPRVSFKAASILSNLPNASANLIRALLAISGEHSDKTRSQLPTEDLLQSICGHGNPDHVRAQTSEDSRVILYAEDKLPLDKFAVFEVPLPPEFTNTKGQRQIRVALAFDPPVRHTRLDYLGLSMGFHLTRGVSQEEVFAHFRKWEREERQSKALQLAKRFLCSLQPRPTRREKGTLQCGTFRANSAFAGYGERYYLVVRCESGWADWIEQQRFAVAVEIRHSANIPLYQRISERIRVRA